jgi:hypothetical protein
LARQAKAWPVALYMGRSGSAFAASA